MQSFHSITSFNNVEDNDKIPEHNFTVKLSDTNLNEITNNDGQSSSLKEEEVKITELSEENTKKLLSRVDEVKIKENDEQEFNVREKSIPAPKTGERIQLPFPPQNPSIQSETLDPNKLQELANQEVDELKIERYSPIGELNVVPVISISFNQPMIAVSSLSEIELKDLPATLKPAVPGKWSWKGTQNLQFEAEHRFPKSTNYQVSIPKGIKSIGGGILKNDFNFQFSTSTVKVLDTFPTRDTKVPDLNPIFYFAFDQKIDQKAFLSTIKLSGSNSKNGGDFILLDEKEIKENEDLKDKFSKALPGQWIAFKLSSELENNVQYVLTIGPGSPSTEGPRLTENPITLKFSTYPPLTITSQSPDTNQHKARPKGTWSLNFSNDLDQNSLSKETIKIEPECEGLAIASNRSSITIRNYSKENTDYKVTVSKDLKDIYGQSLTGGDNVTFRIGARTPNPNISCQTGLFTYDPIVPNPCYNIVVYEYKKILVRVYQVKPADYEDFPQRKGDQEYRQATVPLKLGKLVKDFTPEIPIQDPTVPYKLSLNLADYLQHGNSKLGQLIISVEPEKSEYEKFNQNSKYENREINWCWVQCTNLGITLYSSSNPNLPLYGVITKINDGSPVPNANLIINDETVTSNEHGIAIYKKKIEKSPVRVEATLGDDIAFYPHLYVDNYWSDRHVWFTFDDRKLYKPKEKVNIKGYVRHLLHKDDSVIPTYVTGSVTYDVYDPRGSKLLDGVLELNSFGAFDFSFELKDDVNLGEGRVEFKYKEEYHHHGFSIQEFRRPEFEANTSYLPVTTHVSSNDIGGYAISTAKATYFAGGPLNNANVNWNIRATKSTFSPPGHIGYRFGTARPWFSRVYEGNTVLGAFNHTGKTDKDGEHHLRIDYSGNLIKNSPSPITVVATANVQDVNYQTMSSSTNILLHPSNYYVGYKSNRYFCKPTDKFPIELIVTDVEGKLIKEAKIKVQTKRNWIERTEDKRGLEKLVDREEIVESEVVSSSDKDKPAEFIFEANSKSGLYSFTFIVQDEKGRINKSTFSDFRVSGGFNRRVRSDYSSIPTEEVTLIPNKENYEVGDKGELLIISPFEKSICTFVIECEGAVHVETLELKSETEIITFPVKKEWLPAIRLRVELDGLQNRTNDLGQVVKDKKRPAMASGSIGVNISNKYFELNVVPTPSKKKASPGEEISIEVEVKDKSGSPAQVEVCLVVVDESVLSLAGYQLTNPLSLFYPSRLYGLTVHKSKDQIILLDVESLSNLESSSLIEPVIFEEDDGDEIHCCFGCKQLSFENCSGGMGGLNRCCYASPCCTFTSTTSKSYGGCKNIKDCARENKKKEGGGALNNNAKIAVRSNFDALALFSPSLKTDNSGKCSAKFKLPDNLTRYRIWALAASDTLYGLGESSVSASLPLMVRPSLPRFLNFGDKPDVNVVVQNQTDEQLDVVIALRCTNSSIRNGTGGFNFVLEPTQRVNVKFPIETNFCGIARFQTVVASGDFADSSENSVPVFTPSTSEAFATYGDVTDDKIVIQEVKPPSDVYPQFGGLEISTSSTALQSLTDAVLSLYNYTYECNEQLASRVLGVVSLRDALSAFNVKGTPSLEEINKSVAESLSKLNGRQYENGGFSFWESSTNQTSSLPYVSAHIGHALAICKQKQVQVDDKVVTKLLQYLRNIEEHVKLDWYTEQTRITIISYSLYVLQKHSEDVSSKALQLFEKYGLEKLSLESLGWLLVALSPKKDTLTKSAIESILKHLKNKANETAETANFVTSYGDDGKYVLLHSERRTDAVILEALLTVDEKNSLIPKVAKGILAGKKQGKWNNTQENSLILVALEKYFSVYEKDEPQFVTNMWLGEVYTGEQSWKGRSTETKIVKVPMKHVLEGGEQQTKPFIIEKKGKGRLYYRLGMDYSPRDLNLKSSAHGFFISRSYEGVEDPKDVSRDEKGVWRFALGKKVLVRVELITTSRRYHVALVDKLPSGLEIINPYLKGSSVNISEQTSLNNTSPLKYRWYHPTVWFEHQNFRDERAEAFQSLLWEGKYEYKYFARATTKGTFVVPPATAEEMYSPEIFGRSSSDFVEIN